MFQFAGSPPPRLCVRRGAAGVCPAGFPHSETCGSMDICSSPQLFAACRVFRRLLMPRHPPCALLCLTMALLVPSPGPPSVAPRGVLPGLMPGFLGFPPRAPHPCVRPAPPPGGTSLSGAQIPPPKGDIWVSFSLSVSIRFSRCSVTFRHPGLFRSAPRYGNPSPSRGQAGACLSKICSGGRLLSHAHGIVPSAARAFTAVFGMGTGVPPGRIATGTFLICRLGRRTAAQPLLSSLERR